MSQVCVPQVRSVAAHGFARSQARSAGLQPATRESFAGGVIWAGLGALAAAVIVLLLLAV